MKKVVFSAHKYLKNYYTTAQLAWIAVPLCEYIIEKSSWAVYEQNKGSGDTRVFDESSWKLLEGYF